MFDISKIDKNFSVDTNIDKEDIQFYDADESPFRVYGIFRENDKYTRMKEEVAKKVSEGVYRLHTNTAGGRVRFVTDSPYVAIYAQMGVMARMSHFTFVGTAGFDIYANGIYANTFVPPRDTTDSFEKVIDFEDSRKREITINFPLYSEVKKLYIGLKKDCFLSEAKPYKNTKPIVYYGSSITQGGCASRPGNCYQAIISRDLDYDYINLGFSGNAKGEDEMAEYIAGLDMSAFVYDYDHNAPTFEHLEKTHERMFKIIREKHPSIPVIMMPRPKMLNKDEKKREKLIETTYKNAVSSGDKNVYFIPNSELDKICGTDGTVDKFHPNDLGFYSMAKAVENVIKKINII